MKPRIDHCVDPPKGKVGVVITRGEDDVFIPYDELAPILDKGKALMVEWYRGTERSKR